MSQQQVAQRVGITRRALISIEAGKDCRLSTVRSLCESLGVSLQAEAPSGDGPANGFATAAAMSAHQADRQLAEAMRVQEMTPEQLSGWLAASWGRLQRQALARPPAALAVPTGRVRHFRTMNEKNAFDRKMETARALALALERA